MKRAICAYGTGVRTPIHTTYVPDTNGTRGWVKSRTVYEQGDEQYEVFHGYTSDTQLWRKRITEKPGLRKATNKGEEPSSDPEFVVRMCAFLVVTAHSTC